MLPLLQRFYDTASLSMRCREQLLDSASLAKSSRDTFDYSLLENFEALCNKMSRSWCQLSEGVLTDLRFRLMDVLWQPGCEFRRGLGPIRQPNAKSLLTAILPPRAAGNARTWSLAQRRYEAHIQRLPSARGWRSTWLYWCQLVRDFTCLACATHSFNDVLANCTVLSASIPSVEGRLHKRIRIEETFSKERSEDWGLSIPFSKILMERLEPNWHRKEVSNSGLKGFDRELMRSWLCQFIELGQVLYYLQWQIAKIPLEAAEPTDISLLRPLRESLCDIERNGWVIHSFEEATDYARGLRGYSLYPHRLSRPSACRVSVPPLRELKAKIGQIWRSCLSSKGVQESDLTVLIAYWGRFLQEAQTYLQLMETVCCSDSIERVIFGLSRLYGLLWKLMGESFLLYALLGGCLGWSW